MKYMLLIHQGAAPQLTRSPVVELNLAVALAEAEGSEAGLRAIERLDELDSYEYFHAARADLLRRLGRSAEASAAYERAFALATTPGPGRAPRLRRGS